MTDRYVGPGGADGNNGLTWANRKLTLNGVEDTPVVAGDTVYVGPGVYRELLTVDVSGDVTGGPITYIGDVSGENTDDIGGVVRVTGSANDQTTARADCITASAKDYRTFRGFRFDLASNGGIDCINSQSWVVEDCVFAEFTDYGIDFDQPGIDHIVRRCVFEGMHSHSGNNNIYFRHSSQLDDRNILVENCTFVSQGYGVRINAIGGITIKNNLFSGNVYCVRIANALTAGQTIAVNNCILRSTSVALQGTVTGEIIENYNSFYNNSTSRTNVDTGANSNTFPALLLSPILLDGVMMPWWTPYSLSEWSQVARIAGTGEATDDLHGVARPTTSAKNSWGALQLREGERETGTVQTGSAALTLADAGDHQIFVPVTATSTTFKVAARYESEYAGTLPRLIIRQPGQADQVDTMVAAADTWEDLSLTFAPAADPPYVVVIFRSLNTSVTGDYDTYWDDLDVS